MLHQHSVSYFTVNKWPNELKREKISTQPYLLQELQKTAVIDKNIDKIDDLVLFDRQMKFKLKADIMGIPEKWICQMCHDIMGVKTPMARSVPGLLVFSLQFFFSFSKTY